MADVVTDDVKIPVGGTGIKGFLARPAHGEAFPAILVAQEWWGLNDHIKDITRRLADKGFLALAPDLYDGKVTKDQSVAAGLMQALDERTALKKLSAAVDFLKTHEKVSEGKVGVIGFCMGGSFALLLPCHNKDVRAATAFYGKVPAEEALQSLSAPVLYIYAGCDQWITRQEVERLRTALGKFKKPGEVVTYPNANHAFFNDTRPEVYKADDARDAWNRAVQFFRTNL